MNYLRRRKLPLNEPQSAKPQSAKVATAKGAQTRGSTRVPQTVATRAMNAGMTIHHGHGLSSFTTGTVAQGGGE